MFIILCVEHAYCQSKSVPAHSIIGSVYRRIDEVVAFKGYQEQEGSMLNPTSDNYGISRIAKLGYNILVFERIIPDGIKVRFKLLDTLHIGRLTQRRAVIPVLCDLNKKNDSEIVALVIMDDNEYFTKVIKAWRANKRTNRFERISTKGISCLNDGYGAED